MILLNQMIILFMMAATGILCRKLDIMNDDVSRKLSSLVINVTNPMMILAASINSSEYLDGRQLVITSILSFVIFGVLIAIAGLLPTVLRTDADERGIYKAMLVFSNMGFMGFPVISATYGGNALLLASVFLAPFNILIYTYGIGIIDRSGQREKSLFKQLKKAVNAGIVACVVSIIIYLNRVQVPMPLESFIKSMSGLTTPLSMMIIGDSMAGIDLKKLFTNKKLLVFSLIKLIIVPIGGVSALKLLKLDSTLLGVCMIILATPAASMTAMLAKEYKGNQELATQGVSLTTILCIATIPLVALVTGV